MSQDQRAAPAPLKPYRQPKIVDYGSTSKLSAAKPGNLADAPSPQNMPCL